MYVLYLQVSSYEELVGAARLGGGISAQEKLRAKGKKTPRERYVSSVQLILY